MIEPAVRPITRLGLQIPSFTYPGVPRSKVKRLAPVWTASSGALPNPKMSDT